MKSWKKPTPELINKAVALLARSEQNRYFFDRLENPEWVQPLKAKGIFSSPPNISVDDELVRMVPWPASQYLARMAKKSLDPSSIMDVVLSVPDTDNVRVMTDLVEAALGLPGDIAARLVPKAINWIDTPYNIRLHDRLGDLVGHLAAEEQIEKALDLARELLAVSSRTDSDSKTTEQTDDFSRSKPKIRIQLSDYQSIVQSNVRVLAEKAGIQSVEMFSGFLEAALTYVIDRENRAIPDDMSHILRPAIEDHEQNHDHGIKNILVSAVRDISELIARDNPNQVPSLITNLQHRKWSIFRRLALHLMRLFPVVSVEMIKSTLIDKTMFEDHSIRHEYALLLKEQFKNLDIGSQEQILTCIEQGPANLKQRIEYWERATGNPTSNEEIERFKQSWQLKQLILINEFLSDDWKERFKRLSEQNDIPEHPEFAVFSRVGSRPNSPNSSEELLAFTPDELRDYLVRWVPQRSELGFGPSKEGLGRELSVIVARDPNKFLKELPWYSGLDPTYIRSILQGVAEAIGKRERIEWEHVLGLSAWVVNQDRTIQGRIVGKWDADQDWGSTRNTICHLIAAGFRQENNSIPPRFRTKVWEILSALTDDPNPNPEEENESSNYHQEGNDLQHAINTVRGGAFETVISYALWVRRMIAADPDGESKLARGFDNMPEVRSVLDTHLKIARDPSPAIRAIYGSWFPWLVLLDETWAKQAVRRIFDSGTPRMWKAAWEAYILFREPYDNVLDAMTNVYKEAVERIGEGSTDHRHTSHVEDHLAQHLMAFYWRGKLALEGEDRILSIFFERASDELRGVALEFIGRSLKHTAEPIQSSIARRIISLWQWRLGEGQKDPALHKAEMANFGWWFGSGKLDEAWAMQNLVTVLKLAGRVEPDFLVMERLAEVVDDMTQEVLSCVRMMIESDKNGWDILSWEKELRHILGVAMNSGILEIQRAASTMINRLGERGYLSFRDLLTI